MAEIRLVFFDYGGVLAEEGFQEGLAAIAAGNEWERQAFFDAVREIIFEIGYVYGRAGEAQFWDAVRSRLNITGTDEELRAEILTRFRLRPWMLEVVEAVKAAGVRVAVLSDQVNWLDELEARDGFFHHFEKVFNSYHRGWTKSEPEFFHLALREMGVRADEALLVDDARTNVAVARKVGLEAIFYEGRESFLQQLAQLVPGAWPPRNRPEDRLERT